MTGGIDLARILMEEFRRRQIIVPGITSLERMVSKALLDAERNVGNLLTGSLTSVQCGLLDSLLLQHNAGRISILAWIRQPPGRPGRRAFAEILERLSTLRAIGLEPEVVAPVHPERLRRLNQEGVRLIFLAAPTRILSRDGQLTGVEFVRMDLGEEDKSGRR